MAIPSLFACLNHWSHNSSWTDSSSKDNGSSYVCHIEMVADVPETAQVGCRHSKAWLLEQLFLTSRYCSRGLDSSSAAYRTVESSCTDLKRICLPQRDLQEIRSPQSLMCQYTYSEMQMQTIEICASTRTLVCIDSQTCHIVPRGA
jgi:hypothetical protein